MTPLYRRLLGPAWDRLPAPVQALHDFTGERLAEGFAEVERGGGLLSRLAGRAFGFPAAGRNLPVQVRLVARGDGERWHRTFAGRRFSSTQKARHGLLCERFGPVTVDLALLPDGDRLRLVLHRWSLLGIPLPLRLAPGGETFESAEGDRYRFHVEIAHPWTGLVVRYRGWLEPRQAAD